MRATSQLRTTAGQRLNRVRHLRNRSYTWRVPTTRPRHAITETDEVAAALAAAARRWPDDRDRPSRLLLRLIEAGSEHIAAETERKTAVRRAAIAESAGSLRGVYEPGYLDALREDWPE